MPFFLYRVVDGAYERRDEIVVKTTRKPRKLASSTKSHRKRDKRGTIELAGPNGPFALACRAAYEKTSARSWGMGETSAALLPLLTKKASSTVMQRVGILMEKETTHALVIDVDPDNKSNLVSLYRLHEVWGYSYSTRTVLALHLEALYRDHDVRSSDPDSFKRRFAAPEKTWHVYEFMYLNGGTDGGTWGWGRHGTVNAALLFPEARRALFAKIEEDVQVTGELVAS